MAPSNEIWHTFLFSLETLKHWAPVLSVYSLQPDSVGNLFKISELL